MNKKEYMFFIEPRFTPTNMGDSTLHTGGKPRHIWVGTWLGDLGTALDNFITTPHRGGILGRICANILGHI